MAKEFDLVIDSLRSAATLQSVPLKLWRATDPANHIPGEHTPLAVYLDLIGPPAFYDIIKYLKRLQEKLDFDRQASDDHGSVAEYFQKRPKIKGLCRIYLEF